MSVLSLLRGVIVRVPRGKVITYGQVAATAGFPGAARLTVWALQRAEGLPWHRVVGAGGRIALAGEAGREQRLRLMTEGVKFRQGRVRMDLHGWTPRGGKRPRRPRARAGSVLPWDPARRDPTQCASGRSALKDSPMIPSSNSPPRKRGLSPKVDGIGDPTRSTTHPSLRQE